MRDTRKPVDGKGQREEFVKSENDVIFTRWPCRSLVDVKRKRGMMPCIDVIVTVTQPVECSKILLVAERR